MSRKEDGNPIRSPFFQKSQKPAFAGFNTHDCMFDILLKVGCHWRLLLER